VFWFKLSFFFHDMKDIGLYHISNYVGSLQYTCLNTQFKCRGNGTVSDRCIPASKQCDGHPDCLAGEDEHNCPPKTCPPNQVKYLLIGIQFPCTKVGKFVRYSCGALAVNTKKWTQNFVNL
jgi:hypothetical protein